MGREDFIALMAFAGGPQDLADASAALIAAGPAIDMPLLQRLTGRYGRDAAAALEKLLAQSLALERGFAEGPPGPASEPC